MYRGRPTSQLTSKRNSRLILKIHTHTPMYIMYTRDVCFLFCSVKCKIHAIRYNIFTIRSTNISRKKTIYCVYDIIVERTSCLGPYRNYRTAKFLKTRGRDKNLKAVYYSLYIPAYIMLFNRFLAFKSSCLIN